MRLFLAIDPPEEVKSELYKTIQSLRLKHPDYRWVQPKNYHVTVQFFGEVGNHQEISDRLREILYDAESFQLSTFEMDTFVSNHIHLYLGFYRQKKLEEIVTTIRTDLGGVNKSTFIPHITLSRSALSSKQQYFALKNEISKLDIKLEFQVKELILFESILSGRVPEYRAVDTFPLLSE
jgi:RNA 2',3'-cyclic 3'-phosphodiesterase